MVALVGAPNCGKSTLFNGLTGGGRIVGNWPGTTVEVGSGAVAARRARRASCSTCPAPTASTPTPPTRSSTRAVVARRDGRRPTGRRGRRGRRGPPGAQPLPGRPAAREPDTRLVVALTMVDVAARRGVDRRPGPTRRMCSACPWSPLDPRRRSGLLRACQQPSPHARPPRRPPRPSRAVDPDDELAVADERFSWIDGAVDRRRPPQSEARDPVQRPDRPVGHRTRSPGR